MSYIITVVDGSPGHSDHSLLAEFSTFIQVFWGKNKLPYKTSWGLAAGLINTPWVNHNFGPWLKAFLLAHGCRDCLKFYFPQVNPKRTNTTPIRNFFKSALEVTTKRQLQICTLLNGWATFHMGQGSTLLPAMASNETPEQLCSSLWSAASAEVPACLRVSAPHSFHLPEESVSVPSIHHKNTFLVSVVCPCICS